MKTSFVVYCALVAFALFKTGSAVQCYYCANGDTCEDAEHSSLHECTKSDFPDVGRTAALYKAIEMDPEVGFHCLKLDFTYHGTNGTFRGCTRVYCDNIVPGDPSLVMEGCSTCSSDKCNA